MMPDGFIQQILVHRRAENFVGEIDAADFLVVEIDDVYAGHGYFLALRTTTYPPVGPGTAPFTSNTFSSASTSIISRFRTVTFAVPMCPAIRMPGKTRDGKLDAPMDPGARWNIDPCDPGPPRK